MAEDSPNRLNRPKATLGALRPLAGFALAYKGRIAAAMAALVAASAATLAVPIAVRRVVDFGFSEDSGRMIDAYFGFLVVVVAALAVASALRFYLVVTLGERVVADVRAAVFRHLTSLDPAFFDGVKSGEIVSRLTADTTQVKSAFGVSISIALRNIVLFIGAAALMIVTSPKLSMLVLLAIPVIVVPLVLSGRGVRRRSRAAQDRLADASAYAAEAVGAVRTMQAFGMERATAERFFRRRRAGFWRGTRCHEGAVLALRQHHLSGLGQRRRRVVVRRAGRAGRRNVGRSPVAVCALRRVRRERAGTAL
jgi:ATP-binding cassette subfamily B protein